MTLLDDLKADVTSGRTVAILGTGTSIQATDNAAAASWPGLLRAGIRHAVDTNGNLPPNWEEVTESQIAMGLDGYTPGFVQAEVARVWFDDIRGAVAWEAPRRSFHLDLEAGSLLLMSSLAFRVRP